MKHFVIVEVREKVVKLTVGCDRAAQNSGLSMLNKC